MYAATGADDDHNPSPGEYCHLAGKTSGGSVPLAVPPALLAEDFTQAVDRYHAYVRTVILNNIAYDISWGLFSTWLVETLRINRLHLVRVNSNPDIQGKRYYVHLEFSTRVHAQNARTLLHRNFAHLSPCGIGGLHCFPCKDAKSRRHIGWWD